MTPTDKRVFAMSLSKEAFLRTVNAIDCILQYGEDVSRDEKYKEWVTAFKEEADYRGIRYINGRKL